MSIFDKMKDKAQQFGGHAKENLGEQTGNEDLANSGRGDQAAGEFKEAAHDLKDKATGAAKDLKDKFNS